MGVLKTLVIVVLSLSFIVFIALFGRLPAFRKTPIGFLNRLLTRHLPNALSKIDAVLTGGRIFGSVSSTFNYLMNEKHPLVLIFFVTIQVLGEVLFLPVVYPTVSLLNKLILPPLILLPYYYLYLCATTSSSIPYYLQPHSSTDSEPRQPPPASALHPCHRSALTAYPYDYLLFHPGYFCSTCHHPKPPRSKHCSLCRACIQRQDHHCIWINNCVGRNNHLYFLLLLVSITAVLCYGSVLGYQHLTSLLTQRFAPKELLRGSPSAKARLVLWRSRLSWFDLLDAYVYAFTLTPYVGATTLLTIMCAPLGAGFLIYHIYLLWIGATTNETAKWADWREDIADGLVFRARISELRNRNYKPLPEHVEPASGEVDWPPRDIPRWLWTPKSIVDGNSSSNDNSNVNIEATSESSSSIPSNTSSNSSSRQKRNTNKYKYRYRPEYHYIHTQSEQPPTTTLPPSPHSPRGREVDDTRWERVADFRKEVDNVYDLGFLGNLWEVVFHREQT